MAALCGSYSAFSLSGLREGPEKRVSSRPVVRSLSSCKRLLEFAAGHAQVGLEQIGDRQARVLMQLFGDRLLFGVGQIGTQRQRVSVGTDGEVLDLFEEGLECGRLLRQFLVIPGGGGVGGQGELVRQIDAGVRIGQVDERT